MTCDFQDITACGGICHCDRFSNNVDAWFGLDEFIDCFGDLNVYGAGLGCLPCFDHPADWGASSLGVISSGKRFLMSYDRSAIGQTAARLNNRDARGMIHDLKTGQSRLVPLTIAYIRAPVYHNTLGLECLDDACRASYPSVVPPCDGGVLVGESVEAFFPDMFFYHGYGFPSNQVGVVRCANCHGSLSPFETIFVRHTLDRDRPIPVVFRSGILRQTAFARSGGRIGLDLYTPCTGNLSVPCRARVRNSSCLSGLSFNTTPPESYASISIKNRFDIVHVRENTAQFHNDVPDVDFKNAVLDFVKTAQFPGWVDGNGNTVNPVNFNQLDVPFPNQLFDYWRRDFNFWQFNGTLRTPEELLPVIDTVELSDSHLQNSRCKFNPSLVIRHASIELSLVAHTLLSGGTSFIKPYSKFKITFDLSIKSGTLFNRAGRDATPDQPCQYTRTWLADDDPNQLALPTITQGSIYDEWRPTVTDDVPVYIFAGKEINIPHQIVWSGCLNDHSKPQVPTVPIGNTTDLDNRCRAGLGAMQSVQILGEPTYVDSDRNNPTHIYKGFVTIGFN